MSVKRYDCTGGHYQYCQGCYQMERDDKFGDYVTYEDYKKLEDSITELKLKNDEAKKLIGYT